MYRGITASMYESAMTEINLAQTLEPSAVELLAFTSLLLDKVCEMTGRTIDSVLEEIGDVYRGKEKDRCEKVLSC